MKVLRGILIIVMVVGIGGFAFINVNNHLVADEKTSAAKEIIAAKTSAALSSAKGEGKADGICVEDVTFVEGELVGLISYNGNESAMSVGVTDSSLDHQAMLHAASSKDHLVVLGHSYADGSVFGRLYGISCDDQVIITDLEGNETTYVVTEKIWVDEETYDTASYVQSIFEDNSDLLLITCQTKDGVKGRIIVSCEK